MADDKSTDYRHGFWPRYGHLILISVAYSVFAAIGLATTEASNGHSFVVAIPLIIVSLVIISFWTVFGPSRYWVSFLVGQVFGLSFALICISGFLLVFRHDWVGVDLSSVYFVGLSFVPTATVAAQIPLWIFRGFYGWRLTYRNEPPTSSLSLRDLFVITMVVALAVTAPQYSADLIAGDAVSNLQLGRETYVPKTQPDGTTQLVFEEVRPENIDQLRTQAREQALTNFYQAALIYGGIAAVASILLVPPIWLIFRFRNRTLAYLLIIGYGAFFYALAAAIYSFTNGLTFFLNQVLLSICVVIGITLCCFVLPLAITRYRGFQLTTIRDREDS